MSILAIGVVLLWLLVAYAFDWWPVSVTTAWRNRAAAASLIQQARTARQQGRLAWAADQYQQALVLDSGPVQWAAEWALCLDALGNRQQAIDIMKRVVERDPNNLAWQRHWAEWLAEEGRVWEADEVLQEAVERYPADMELQAQRLSNWLHQGRYDAVIQEAESLLTAHPNARRLLFLFAQATARRGDNTKAVPLFRRLLAFPGAPEIIHREIGICLAKTAYYHEAIQELEQASEDDAVTHYWRGMCHGNLGESQRALEHFQQAWKLDPRHSAARSEWGKMLVRQGDYEAAVPLFREALQMNPLNTQARYQLAMALVRMGKREEGRQEMKRFVADNARADEIRRVFDVVYSAPENAQALHRLGKLFAEAGDMNKAEGYLQAALRRNPNLRAAHQQLAQLYHQRGDQTRAAWHLDQAKRLTQ